MKPLMTSGFWIGVTAGGLGGEGTKLLFRIKAAKKNRYVPGGAFPEEIVLFRFRPMTYIVGVHQRASASL